jgi:hypothetical protein
MRSPVKRGKVDIPQVLGEEEELVVKGSAFVRDPQEAEGAGSKDGDQKLAAGMKTSSSQGKESSPEIPWAERPEVDRPPSTALESATSGQSCDRC